MTELQTALHDFVKGRIAQTIFPAKVTVVDGIALTCDVTDVDGNEFFDIRLRSALEGTEEGKVYLPKVGTWVLVGNVANSESEFCVMMWSEVTKCQWFIRPVKFRMDVNGFLIEKSGDTLAEMMADLMGALADLTDALQLLTVTCAAPGSPSSPPVNVASFAAVGASLAAIEVRFNNILKSS